MAGYPLSKIPRSTYGDLSKIEKEMADLKDATAQGVVLCEISELLGAAEEYLYQEALLGVRLGGPPRNAEGHGPLGSCRFVCNPSGYWRREENPSFRPDLTLEV